MSKNRHECFRMANLFDKHIEQTEFKKEGFEILAQIVKSFKELTI